MVLARFLPHDERFFDYFRDAAANATEAAQLLVEVFAGQDEVERKVRRLRDLEHRGDEITHNVINALNSTFVTPLDREDIRDLVGKIDDFVDDIEEVAQRFWLYRITEVTKPGHLLARIIREQAQLVAEAVPMLEHAKQSTALLRQTVEVNRLENEADEALSRALGALFDHADDIPTLVQAIRWGELYGLLEDATDRGEDIANTLEGIVLKNA